MRLPIGGDRGDPVPNTSLRQGGEVDHVAILLPGKGYTCDGSLFSHAENLLVGAGADVLRVDYASGHREDFRAFPHAERARWLSGDVTAA